MAWDSDQDIASVFQSFGYSPTAAEIAALKPSFGEGFGASTAISAVGQYVNFKRSADEFAKNDPLNALQTRMNGIIDQNTASVKGLYQQLQDTLSAAPKLFGSLTPDQINEYLAPLQTEFKAQLASVQSATAARGLAASSTENNAMAQTDQNFKENTLSAGLNVGIQSQKDKAAAIQQQISNLFGQTGQAMGITGQAAGQKSAQDLGQSNLIASLPSFLNANSAQMAAFMKQFNPDTGGFQNMFDQVTGDINKAGGAISTIGSIASMFKGGIPGAAGAGAAAPPASSFPQGSPSASASLFNSSSTPGYRPTDTGALSLFGS